MESEERDRTDDALRMRFLDDLTNTTMLPNGF